MPEKGLFSGNFALPTGALDLLAREDENSVDPNDSIIQHLTDPNIDIEGTGGSTVIWGLIAEDGTITADSGITSVSRLAEGVYEVTMDSSFTAVGNTWSGAAVVTPESVPTTAGTATTNEYYGLHTVSVDFDQSGVQYDSQTGQLWATDENSQALGIAANGFPYVAPDTTGSDRIAIYKIDTNTWRYIYLPDLWEINYLQEGELLMLNVPERVAYVQAAGTAGGAKAGFRTTLIYDLDTLELLQNTHDDIYSGTGTCIIIGWDNTNDKIITGEGTRTAIYAMSAGLLSGAAIDSDPTFYSVTKRLLCDNNGKFWHPTGTHPKDWRRWYLVASVLTTDTIDAGADGISETPDVYCFDSTNNEIYFLTNNELILKKIDCDSPNTITSIHTYSALAANNHNTEISQLTALEMSSDNSRLIGIRGSASTYCCFFIIDPADGSIDFHYDLPATRSSNFDTQNIAVSEGVAWSLGSNVIQEVRFTGAETNTALQIYDPVFQAVRFTAANKILVQFFKGNNYRVHQDSAFHIHVTDSLVGSGSSVTVTAGIPQLIKDANYTLTLAEANYHLYHTSASAHTYTIPANASVAFPIGTCVSFVNSNGAGAITIAITSDTLRWAGSTSTGSRTLAANGIATIIKVASTLWYINGEGLT